MDNHLSCQCCGLRSWRSSVLVIVAFALMLAAFAWSASAAPIVDASAVSTDDGQYSLTLSLTNNLTTTDPAADPLRLYIFGVALPAHTITDSPSTWDAMNGDDPHLGDYYVWGCQFNCNNWHYGGSGIHYNNWWSGLTKEGATSTGFVVLAPTLIDVRWFAFAYGQSQASHYAGADYAYFDWNPLFEGVVSPVVEQPTQSFTQSASFDRAVTVPEPTTALLMVVGAFVFRRKHA